LIKLNKLGYAIVTIEFSDNAEKYIGWLEVASGLGLVGGPLIGSVLYGFISYKYTFISFGVFFFLSGIFL